MITEGGYLIMKIINPKVLINPIDDPASTNIGEYLREKASKCKIRKITKYTSSNFAKDSTTPGAIVVHMVLNRRSAMSLIRYGEAIPELSIFKADKDIKFVTPYWLDNIIADDTTYDIKWNKCLGDHSIDPFEEGSIESEWFWACANSERSYRKLCRNTDKFSDYDAMTVLNGYLATEVCIRKDIQALRVFIKRCTSTQYIDPEISRIAIMLLRVLYKYLPNEFKDFRSLLDN